MKTPPVIRLLPAFLLVGAAWADAPTPKDELRPRTRREERLRVLDDDDRAPLAKEKVAYLGVETMPVGRTVSTQLGLPRDTGLVVRRVADNSPASSLLKEHDILTKFEDQILVDMHQLSVLVRSRKAGDEVKLTVMRGGKETVVKAKLGEREVPVLAGDFPEMMPGAGADTFFFSQGGPGMPPMGGPGPGDVMRLIGRDRGHWFAAPRVHLFKHSGDKGSTLLDLPSGNFVFSDDEGSVEVASNAGKRELTVKNKKGDVTFQGPLNTPEDHDKLPPEVLSRLHVIGGAELGDDDEDLKFETRVFEPATKTRHHLPPPDLPPLEPGMRSL